MSNGAFGYFLTFTIGATVGAVVAWKVLSDKYEQEIQNEIAALRELRSNNVTSDEQVALEDVNSVQKKTGEEYIRMLNNHGYTKYGDATDIPEDVPDTSDEPYVISPEEFAMVGYKVENLVYYTDGVLANDDMHILDDIESTIGEESLARFGEYEDDSVHVRNDALRIDYEILLSSKSYSEAMASLHPYDMEE